MTPYISARCLPSSCCRNACRGRCCRWRKLINQYDEARIAVAVVGKLVNQPAEEGRSRERRAHAD